MTLEHPPFQQDDYCYLPDSHKLPLPFPSPTHHKPNSVKQRHRILWHPSETESHTHSIAPSPTRAGAFPTIHTDSGSSPHNQVREYSPACTYTGSSVECCACNYSENTHRDDYASSIAWPEVTCSCWKQKFFMQMTFSYWLQRKRKETSSCCGSISHL